MHNNSLSFSFFTGDGSDGKDECPKDVVPDTVRPQVPDTFYQDDDIVASDEDGLTTVESEAEVASTSGDEYAASTHDEESETSEESDVEMEPVVTNLSPETRKMVKRTLDMQEQDSRALHDFTKGQSETMKLQLVSQNQFDERLMDDRKNLTDGQLRVMESTSLAFKKQAEGRNNILKLLTPAKKKTPRRKIMKTPLTKSTTKRVRSSSKNPCMAPTSGSKRALFDTVPNISASKPVSVIVDATLDRELNGQTMFKIFTVGGNVLEVPKKLPFTQLSPRDQIYMDIDGNGTVCLFKDVPADGECLAWCMEYHYNRRHDGNKSATEIRHGLANVLAANNGAGAHQFLEVLRGYQLLSYQDEPEKIHGLIETMYRRLSLHRIVGSKDYMEFDDCLLYSLMFDKQSNIKIVSDRKSGFESLSTKTMLEAVYAHPEIDRQKLPELPGGTWAPMYFLNHTFGRSTGSFTMGANHYGLLLPANPEDYKNLPIYKGGGKWDLSGVTSAAYLLGLTGNDEVGMAAPPSNKRRRM